MTLTDKHIPLSPFGSFAFYVPEVASAQDYYPFGMIMPGRNHNDSLFRFGFNNQEKDDEIAGIGNHISTFYREGDVRLGLWWGVDPETHEQPWQSPYSFMDGNPVSLIDPLGNSGKSHDVVMYTNFHGFKFTLNLTRTAGRLVGLYETGKTTLVGLYNVLRHPQAIEKTVNHAMNHPVETGKALYKEGKKEYDTYKKGDSFDKGRVEGHIAGAVAIAAMTDGMGDAAEGGNVTEVLSALKIPQGLTSKQFVAISDALQKGVGNISEDIVVQGSRAAGTASASSDVDIAIRVSQGEFDALIKKAFGTPSPGSAKEKTMLHAIETGKISARWSGMSNLREEIAKITGMKVDLSIIKRGGLFDNGKIIRIKK